MRLRANVNLEHTRAPVLTIRGIEWKKVVGVLNFVTLVDLLF